MCWVTSFAEGFCFAVVVGVVVAVVVLMRSLVPVGKLCAWSRVNGNVNTGAGRGWSFCFTCCKKEMVGVAAGL